MTASTFQNFILIWIAIAIILIPIQLFVTAPYGRHTNTSWGATIPNKLGWIIMEVVSPLVFAYFFITGPVEKSPPMWFFFALWLGHYFNRSIIFPLRTRTSGKRIPILIVLSAIFFNLVNGWTNGYYLGYFSPTYPDSWFTDPRFIIGTIIFVTGAFINLQSDHILINLRKPGEKGYKIPTGGLFSYISCPNLFGEILEWTGFAILCWNLPAAGFAIWTAANLIPRALSHHRWYLSKFEDYPKERKAVLPGVL